MTKNELRTGMVVELRNGQRRLVLIGDLPTYHHGNQTMMLISATGHQGLEKYTDDLRYLPNNVYDITKVFKVNMSNFSAMLGTATEPIWAREPEVDWSKVAVDTKVYVRDFDHHQWKPKHFARYQGGKVFTWLGGNTSFTENTDIAWKYAKLAKEVRQ